MMQNSSPRVLVLALCVFVFGALPAAAAGKPPSVLKTIKIKKPGQGRVPAWVKLGQGRTARCELTGGKVALCGVGMVRGVRNRSLARQAADGRARAALVRRIESVDPATRQRRVLVVGKLKGAEIYRRYRARNGALYALAIIR